MTPSGQDPIELRVAETSEPERLSTRQTLARSSCGRFTAPRLEDGQTRVSYRMKITGPAADSLGPEIGPQISGDFPELLAALVDRARSAEERA